MLLGMLLVAVNAATVADDQGCPEFVSINVFTEAGVDVVVFYLVLSAANTEQSTL